MLNKEKNHVRQDSPLRRSKTRIKKALDDETKSCSATGSWSDSIASSRSNNTVSLGASNFGNSCRRAWQSDGGWMAEIRGNFPWRYRRYRDTDIRVRSPNTSARS